MASEPMIQVEVWELLNVLEGMYEHRGGCQMPAVPAVREMFEFDGRTYAVVRREWSVGEDFRTRVRLTVAPPDRVDWADVLESLGILGEAK